MNQLNSIHYLKKEVDNWLSILEIWKNHISFLKARLQSLEDRGGERANTYHYQDLDQQISYLIDSVIPDYQKSLQDHNADLETQNDPNPVWLEEHHLYHRHMRQLRNEYKQVIHKILVEIAKI